MFISRMPRTDFGLRVNIMFGIVNRNSHFAAAQRNKFKLAVVGYDIPGRKYAFDVGAHSTIYNNGIFSEFQAPLGYWPQIGNKADTQDYCFNIER